MKSFLRQLIPNQHPLRLVYHKMMSVAAAVIYRFPADQLEIVAITGTNGKTTTSNILHAIFMEAGKKAGMLTTVNFKIGDQVETNLTKQTTVSPFLLQKKLRQMVEAGCKVAIVEATSHAMIQQRLWGVNVDTAVFTNLSQDHLSYHKTMEAYREAKGRLFAGLNTAKRKPNVPKISVINQDDPEAEYFADFPVDQLFQYGIQRGTYAGRNLEERPDGTTFTLKIPNGEEEVDFKIPGRMNVYNAVAAATVAVAHHINLLTIKAALEGMNPVPGRMEPIKEGQPFNVIVDYAHTADALDQLCSLFKGVTQGRLIVVFGATGGGRDQSKRPIMGEVVNKYADIVILTDDDPYDEDPREIAQMVRAGIPREEGDNFWQVLDRKSAIRLALEMAKEGDTVVVAGKGAEEFQVTAMGRVPHDDRVVVREILSREVELDLGRGVQ